MPLTLARLNPHLQKMFDLADELLAEDNEIKKREKEASENNYLNFAADYSFNDILCSDLKPNMRKLIEDVCCVTYHVGRTILFFDFSLGDCG